MAAITFDAVQKTFARSGTSFLAVDRIDLVIADKDPGVGNFVYTDHHESGTMLLRWVSATSDPQPRCRVVKLASLGAGTVG